MTPSRFANKLHNLCRSVLRLQKDHVVVVSTRQDDEELSSGSEPHPEVIALRAQVEARSSAHLREAATGRAGLAFYLRPFEDKLSKFN